MMPSFVLIMIAAAGVAGLVFALPRLYARPELGAYAFIFLSSITISPDLPLVEDRLIFADLVMAVTIGVLISSGRFFERLPKEKRLFDILAMTFFMIVALSSVVALFSNADATRTVFFTIIYFYGYCAFRAMLILIDDEVKLVRLLLVWMSGAALVVTVGVLAASGVIAPDWAFDEKIGRLSATMQNSGQVSSYIGPVLLAYFFVATATSVSLKWRLFALAIIAGSCVVLLGTGSRISFMMMLVSIVYACAVVMLSSSRTIGRGLPMAAALVGGIVFASYSVTVWQDTSEEYGLLTTSPFERAIRMFAERTRNEEAGIEEWGGTRYDEISIALDNIEKHPVFGTGSGAFSRTYKINEVHNTYVNVLAENGALAFLALVAWWGLIAVTLMRLSLRGGGQRQRFLSRLAFGGFIILCLYQMTTNGLRQRPFWFASATAICFIAVASRRETSQRRGSAAPPAAQTA